MSYLFSTGIEPATLSLKDLHSIQMSYEGTRSWLPYYIPQISKENLKTIFDSKWWNRTIVSKRKFCELSTTLIHRSKFLMTIRDYFIPKIFLIVELLLSLQSINNPNISNNIPIMIRILILELIHMNDNAIIITAIINFINLILFR